MQSFFKDVESRNPDAIYCLGDLVGYNIWPNEVVNDNSSALNKDSIKVKFIRFNYDVEASAKAVEESPLPNEYAYSLRNGI